MKKSLKALYIGLGFLFAGLGFIGVILPVLPTTPFLLLASFFFSRGSERFNRWFTGTKLYKNHLEEFLQSRSMTRKTKVSLLAFASSVLLLSAYLVKNTYVRWFIAFVIVYKYYYFVFKIKTLKSDSGGEDKLRDAKRI
jgi:uncharacterized membrane protein YbaN (DUF454 family)